MKKIILALSSVIILSFLFISCSDDSSSTSPDNTPKFRITEDNLYTYLDSKAWSPHKNTNYTYDELGRIVEKEFIDNSDFEESYTDSFFYNLSSKYPYEIRRYKDVGKLSTLSNILSFTYTNGKPTEIIESVRNTDTGVMTKRYKTNYTYENNLIVNESSYRYNTDTETWELYSDYDLNYIDGKITSTSVIIAGGSGVETFTYSGDKLTELNIDYTIWTFHIKYRYLLFYENGNVASAEIQDYVDGDGIWVKEEKMDYKFVNDKLSEEFYYQWYDIKDWNAYYKNSYTYDTNELITLIENFSWNGTDSTYVLSVDDSKQEYIYEVGTGNYIELDMCLNPLFYYTGGHTNIFNPEPQPIKSSKIFSDESIPAILKNAVNKKLDAALRKEVIKESPKSWRRR